MIEGLTSFIVEVIKPGMPPIAIGDDPRRGFMRNPNKMRATVEFEWYDDQQPPPEVMRFAEAIKQT